MTTSETIVTWGRAKEASRPSFLGTLGLMVFSPLMVFYFYISAFHYNGAFLIPMEGILEKLPPFSIEVAALVLCWLLMQVVLALLPDLFHKIIPSYQGGRVQGAVTPAGHRLWYRINGLQAWAISHLLFFAGAFRLEVLSSTFIFDHWGEILWVANGLGISLAIFVYVKALYFPSHPEDRKFSGNALYDFFMGVELNPRLGPIDLKLFFNGRPGIVAWTLINLSFASAQYARYGSLSNSMILINILQGLYVLYFFWKEAWYLKTIDIHHDHFGWMLAWGDSVWLPFMYTLQALYLVFNPVELSFAYALFVLVFGLVGFYIFASANHQKDHFRMHEGQVVIWGKKADSLSCTYRTQDGTVRQTRLLKSGWWGIGRHMNYTGDLILSLAYSFACGLDSLFPYFYFVFLAILLVHRCLRDEERCRLKYGAAWQAYTQEVPWRLIPHVW